jgi:hypothetical protein
MEFSASNTATLAIASGLVKKTVGVGVPTTVDWRIRFHWMTTSSGCATAAAGAVRANSVAAPRIHRPGRTRMLVPS